MAAFETSPARDDDVGSSADRLRALAWVREEIRRTLESAQKAVRRTLKEAESLRGSDVSAADPAPLRGARNQWHQVAGVLEMVGHPQAGRLARAAEAALQRIVAKPALLDAASAQTLETASFGLTDLIDRLCAGKPVSPVALFPQYSALQQLAGADRIHPADLWEHAWDWPEVPAEPGVDPLPADAATRSRMEGLILQLMRQADPSSQRAMSELCAGLSAGAQGRAASLWALAAALYEAQSSGLLVPDAHAKRVGARLLGVLRSGMGSPEAAHRLAHDLLFFCARATPPDGTHPAPRLQAVRRACALEGQEGPPSYDEARLGRFDPAWVQLARKRVSSARDAWSEVASEDLTRLSGLAEPFALVADSVQRLYPQGDRLAAALQEAANLTVQSRQAPAPGLAMEVATAVLYLEASLEDGDLEHADLGQRVATLAGRIDAVRAGGMPQPLEPWMEDVYRRVSDRQTMGSVVLELRQALEQVETRVDQYFRDPSHPESLGPVALQLGALRGVLSVLGLESASQAVLQLRDDTEQLALGGLSSADGAVGGDVSERLTENLGSLTFLVDMLGVQPRAAKALFVFDSATRRLRTVMGQAARPAAQVVAPVPPAPVLAPVVAPPPMVAMPMVAPVVEPLLEVQAEPPALETPPAADFTLDFDLPIAAAAGPEESRGRDAGEAPPEAVVLDLAAAMDLPTEPSVQAPVSAPAEAPSEVPAERAAQPEAEPVPAEVGLDLSFDLPVEPAPLIAQEAAEAAAEPGAVPALVAPPVVAPAIAPPASAPGEDDEMREIFLEEAREVIEGASAAMDRLSAPGGWHAVEDLTEIRRAFHTLKGSARMVGLRAYGEAAWSAEQLYNARLAQGAEARMDAPLREFTGRALQQMQEWVLAIAAGAADASDTTPLIQAADSLRMAGREGTPPAAPVVPAVPAVPAVPSAPVQPVEVAAIEPPTLDLPAELPAELPADWPADLIPELAVEAVDPSPLLSPELAEPAAELAEVAEVSFTLDLGDEPREVAAELAQELPPAEPAAELPLSAATLINLVPGLPSAADLELTPPISVSEPVPVTSAESPPEPPLAAAAEAEETFEDIVPPAPQPQAASEPVLDADLDEFKQIGPLQVELGMFNIFLNEADELSRRLATELAEWATAADGPPAESVVATAHSLAGCSGTVGFADLSAVARALEHALGWQREAGTFDTSASGLFLEAADDIRRLLHQFAAGFLKSAEPGLVQRLESHRPVSPLPPAEEPDVERATEAVPEPAQPFEELSREGDPAPLEPMAEAPSEAEWAQAPVAAAGPEALESLETLEVPAPPPPAPAPKPALEDMVDPDLFPIFAEEAEELLPQLQSRLQDWLSRPYEVGAASACMRTLHTFKGGARLAGAMRLGEQAHLLETAVERLAASPRVTAADIEPLLAAADALQAGFEVLRYPDRVPPAPLPMAEVIPLPLPATLPPDLQAGAQPDLPAAAAETSALGEPPQVAVEPALQAALAPAASAPAGEAPAPLSGVAAEPAAPPAPPPAVQIDWSRFAGAGQAPAAVERAAPTAPATAVKVRAPLLERMVNQAGEVSIARARIEVEVGHLRSALSDLTDNLERLRRQLRDIEVQAETQINSRLEAAKSSAQSFDPLEMDRFTRFQELTRMMAESVNDVATIQRGLQKALQTTEDELATQARLTRSLQDDLMSTRMVEFESLADRLHRVVRLAARDTGKQARLEIVGGGIEMDRGVLERMTGPFEHLLRNSVAHGIEAPAVRTSAGKDPTGVVTVALSQEGNEVALEFRDDGAGLNLQRIRDRAVSIGALNASAQPTDSELASFIFASGFSTAASVTELAGRGVGLDVVRSEVMTMGGRIETTTEAGRGTCFRLVLPLTTAVTQVVLMRAGEFTVAVPSTLVEGVRRADAQLVERCYESGQFASDNGDVPFHWLGALLEGPVRGGAGGRGQAIVSVRSAAQRVALHVEEVIGNQEVVVKHLGPQLSRLPGLAGVTLLPSGLIAPIYNPVALATLYGEGIRERLRAPQAQAQQAQPAEAAEPLAPLVLVVDDSLTVRRVTQRLLQREGYRVALAKDGLDALERLAEEKPAVVLSDIEMPRMDGFDLVRNLRSDARLSDLAVIMITSRIAQKHRDYAAQLGVDHYLGKPYSEEELMSLVRRYAHAPQTAA